MGGFEGINNNNKWKKTPRSMGTEFWGKQKGSRGGRRSAVGRKRRDRGRPIGLGQGAVRMQLGECVRVSLLYVLCTCRCGLSHADRLYESSSSPFFSGLCGLNMFPIADSKRLIAPKHLCIANRVPCGQRAGSAGLRRNRPERGPLLHLAVDTCAAAGAEATRPPWPPCRESTCYSVPCSPREDLARCVAPRGARAALSSPCVSAGGGVPGRRQPAGCCIPRHLTRITYRHRLHDSSGTRSSYMHNAEFASVATSFIIPCLRLVCGDWVLPV